MRELDGFKEEFYLLGRLWNREFIDEDNYFVSNPIQAKRFNTYRDAANYYDKNKLIFSEKLYPQEVRVTFEYI